MFFFCTEKRHMLIKTSGIFYYTITYSYVTEVGCFVTPTKIEKQVPAFGFAKRTKHQNGFWFFIFCLLFQNSLSRAHPESTWLAQWLSHQIVNTICSFMLSGNCCYAKCCPWIPYFNFPLCIPIAHLDYHIMQHSVSSSVQWSLW